MDNDLKFAASGLENHKNCIYKYVSCNYKICVNSDSCHRARLFCTVMHGLALIIEYQY